MDEPLKYYQKAADGYINKDRKIRNKEALNKVIEIYEKRDIEFDRYKYGFDYNKNKEKIVWYFAAANEGHEVALLTLINSSEGKKGTLPIQYYQNAAELGHPYACYKLGMSYSGFEGIRWLEKAAELGNKEALSQIINNLDEIKSKGGSYWRGFSDPGKWYQKAAEQGSVDALFVVIDFYEKDQGGLSKEDLDAGSWYKKAAANYSYKRYSEVPIIFRLIDLYEKKQGGLSKEDPDTGSWYKKAAEQGYQLALFELIEFYEKSQGGLLKEDPDVGSWYKKAAEQGYQLALFKLIELYEKGQGGLSKDDPDAGFWYNKAVSQGPKGFDQFIETLYLLAQMYGIGQGGLKKDDKKARDLYQKAAEQGHNKAQLALGQMCEQGCGGLLDVNAALLWYEKAAGSLVDAQYNAGRLHATGGSGMAINLPKAQVWYQKAVAQGHELAKKALTNIATTSSSEGNALRALSLQGVEQFRALQISFTIPHSDITLQNELGRGGFGVVYQGTLRHTTVAVKQLYSNQLSEGASASFQQEAEVMANLRSPYIVQLYGVCIDSKPYCMVMEYMEKGSLYSVLHSSTPLDWTKKQQIAVEIAQGLDYLHSVKIIHRDLKTLNVLLGRNYEAKLTDFGLAEVKKEVVGQSAQTHAVGTTYWMAPELFARKPQYTEKTDTYAYAMTIWELVTQQVPYADADNTAMVPMWVMNGDRETIPEDCPELFRDIITGCWAGNPSERPSLSQVITQLKQSAPLPLLPATTGPSSSHYAGNLGNVSSPLPLATSYDSIAVSSVGYQGNVSTPRPPTQLPSYGANTSSASSSGYQGNLAPPSSGFSVRPS